MKNHFRPKAQFNEAKPENYFGYSKFFPYILMISLKNKIIIDRFSSIF